MKEASDVKRATESVDSVKAAVAALDGQLAEDIAAVTAKLDQDAPLERIPARAEARPGRSAVRGAGVVPERRTGA